MTTYKSKKKDSYQLIDIKNDYIKESHINKNVSGYYDVVLIQQHNTMNRYVIHDGIICLELVSVRIHIDLRN